MNAADRARILRDRIADLDNSVPRGAAFLDLLTGICRSASTKARQDAAYCSYGWANTEEYQARMFATIRRLRRHGERLSQRWPGASLELSNDPRGFVVRIILPNGKNEAMAGGVGVA